MGSPDYHVTISTQTEDARWDAFVASVPDGDHVQTGLWANVKAYQGWHSLRVVISHNGTILGGAQMLLRPLRPFGNIGYVTRGPILNAPDERLGELILQELQNLTRRHHIHYLVLQPPCHDTTFIPLLPQWGFRPGHTAVAPTASVLIDLHQDIGAIQEQMHRKTRYNIRRSAKMGVTVREGTEADLAVFYQLLQATGQRQGFVTYPEAYFRHMWQVLAPCGHLQLFIAEYEGEAVATYLVVSFGQVVVSKKSGWSGRYGNLKPNEILRWEAIHWAKMHGYHYYDMGGIDPLIAQELLDGHPLTSDMQQSPSGFKLRSGGAVTLFPGPYDYIANPSLRWGYHRVFPLLSRLSIVQTLLNQLVKAH